MGNGEVTWFDGYAVDKLIVPAFATTKEIKILLDQPWEVLSEPSLERINPNYRRNSDEDLRQAERNLKLHPGLETFRALSRLRERMGMTSLSWRERAQEGATAEWNRIQDQFIEISEVDAGTEDGDMVTIELNPPSIFRVLRLPGYPYGSDDTELHREIAGWLQPVYGLKPTNPDDSRLIPYERFWIHGSTWQLEDKPIGESSEYQAIYKIIE